MATASNVTLKQVQKSGTNLDNLEKISLVKDVPVVAEVASIEEALQRVAGDNSKLLGLITAGLQEQAMEQARKDDNGWKLVDEETGEKSDFSGTLVDPAILNPVISQYAKQITPATVTRTVKNPETGEDEKVQVEIFWDDAQTADEKRECKAAALAMIKSQPNVVAGLKKRQAMANK